MDPITLAVIEDREQYRTAMKRLFEQKSDLKCVGIFGSAEQALEVIPSQIVPHIVLMDIDLPGISGVEAVELLQKTAPEIEVMMLTIFEDSNSVFQALKAGATGYILKTSSPEEIYEYIIDLAQGGSPMSDGIARKVVRFFRESSQKRSFFFIPPDEKFALTHRENEIIQFLVKGYRYKEIAQQLHLSTDTVRKHIHNIYRKLQVHSRAQAMIKFQESKLS